jgi:tetratricopeptide (TPR) repeat protein
MRLRQLPAQPGVRQPKLVADDVHGAAHHLGRLFGSHASEVTHLDQLGQRTVLARQSIDGQFHVENLHRLGAGDGFQFDGRIANPGARYAIYLSANAAHDRAIAADATGQPGQMIAEASKVRERFDQLVRLGNLNRKEINAATYIYASLADRYIHLHRFQDAVRYARAGIDISRTNSTVSGPRAETFSVLATALKYLGDFQGALKANREARSEFEKYRRYETDFAGTL